MGGDPFSRQLLRFGDFLVAHQFGHFGTLKPGRLIPAHGSQIKPLVSNYIITWRAVATCRIRQPQNVKRGGIPRLGCYFEIYQVSVFLTHIPLPAGAPASAAPAALFGAPARTADLDLIPQFREKYCSSVSSVAA